VATLLAGIESGFRRIIYGYSFISRENLARIGSVDLEVTGLTEIVNK